MKKLKLIIALLALIVIVNIVFIKFNALWLDIIEFIVLIAFFIDSIIYYIDKKK